MKPQVLSQRKDKINKVLTCSETNLAKNKATARNNLVFQKTLFLRPYD